MKGVVRALAAEAIVLAALLTVAMDVWAHKRVEQLGGVNMWGYRGPVLPRKQPNEIRIAFAGGDLAFGWGEAAGGTLPAAVRQLVMLITDRPGGALHPATAVNLGALGLPPRQYVAWIERFAYLDPTVICIVPDPRTRWPQRASLLPDRASATFALFGYAPMLPLVLQEKGAIVGSRALSAVGRAGAALDHALARAIGRVPAGADGISSTGEYVAAIEAAVRSALAAGASVALIAPPYYRDGEVEDHEALAAMMAARFGAEHRVRFLDLGDEPDIYDDGLRLNDFDFSSAGIARAAQLIAPAVTDLVRAAIQ